jgi:transposase
MSGFIQGQARTQSTLFPEMLDDFVVEDCAVRIIDLFIDDLNLANLGFKTEPNSKGRPAYHPIILLKIYVYGYFNQVHSSRRLEREAQRNIELMWLTGRLAPDFKTIADFRKDNREAIRLVCREFVMLCKHVGLFKDALVAIDGSKFKAVNNRDKNFTRAKMVRRLSDVEASIDRYLDSLANVDEQESKSDNGKTEQLKQKVAALKEEMARLKALEVEMLNAPDQQISETDPDARSMKTRGQGLVGYNVQTAVDVSSHLIVNHDVTNVGNDRNLLAGVAIETKAVLEIDSLTAIADRGYYKGEQIKACEDNNITVFIPKSDTSGNRAKDLFTKDKFIYITDVDEYECPAGARMTYRFTTKESGKLIRRYATPACTTCSIKDKCTTSKQARRISRWEHEDVLDRAQERLNANWDMMAIRSATVEHPFGTIKSWMGYTHFLTKTLGGVRAEMSLHVLAYNMKRMINIMGIGALMEAMRA